MTVGRFERRRLVVEAVQWSGSNEAAVWQLFDGSDGGYIAPDGGLYVRRADLRSEWARPGVWVVKTEGGRLELVDPVVFAATYDPVWVTKDAEGVADLRDRLAVAFNSDPLVAHPGGAVLSRRGACERLADTVLRVLGEAQ